MRGVSMGWLFAPIRTLFGAASLHRTLSVGYLRQRWMRSGLVVASIALGVATLVATRAVTANLMQSAKAAANPLSGRTHLVVSNGQAGVPRSVVETIKGAGDPAIRDVAPMTYGRAAIPELDNRSVMLLGIPMSLDKRDEFKGDALGVEVRWTESAADIAGYIFAGRALVGLSDTLADDLAVLPGGATRFRLRVAGNKLAAAGVAAVKVLRAEERLDKNVVYLDIADAGKLVFPDRPDSVSQINIILHSPADAAAVRDRLRDLIGPPYHVQTIKESFESVTDITAGLELGFAIGGACALVIGLFLVYNALSVSVAERRHDIGIMRAVGATRGQIAGLFVGEALVLGLFGSLLGIPLGYGIAHVALGPISRVLSEMFTPIESPAVVVSYPTLALAVAAGTLTTILASLVPAIQASREEPADAVRRVPVSLHAFYRLAQAAGAAWLVGAGVLCVLFRARLPQRFGVFSGVIFVLVGALVATPLFAAILSRFLRPVFRRIFGLEGRLAADNLARSPGRTGIVIAALAATGALMVTTAGYIHSAEDAVVRWLDESIAADLFVTAGAPLTERTSEAMPMDEKLGEQLKAIPGVEAALPLRISYLEYQNRIVALIALDADAFRNSVERHALGRNLQQFPRLREPGTALVSINFAALNNVKIGDRLTIDGLDRPLEVEVIGTVLDYTWPRGSIIVNRAWFKEQYRDSQVNIFDVYLKGGTDRAAVMDEIRRRWGSADAVCVVDRDEARRGITTVLRRIYGIGYAQEIIVGMVALLGVMSALFISVLQRRRELGLLRAVGASRGQVLRSVLAEAFQMGVIGGLLGFGVGLLLEWYVIDVVLLDESGLIFPILVPWIGAGVVFVGSVLTASLVGLWPAWHATRIRIAEAIAYE
jgi:putative ABC transport system permease protein